MLFASLGDDCTEQVYMTELWTSFETIIQQAEHDIIVSYLWNEWDLQQLTTIVMLEWTNSYNVYANFIICHDFDNNIGIINAYQLAVTLDKSLKSPPRLME